MGEIFKFLPFNSFVYPSFWYKLSELKLEVDRLNDAPRKIYGFFSNSDVTKSLLYMEVVAFNEQLEEKACSFTSHGILFNKNTLEEFKECDKLALLAAQGHSIWESIKNGNALKDPSLFSRFILLSFADLKSHNFYYWFAFPTIGEIVATTVGPTEHVPLTDHFSPNEFEQFSQLYFKIELQKNKSIFFVERQNTQLVYRHLSEKINHLDKLANFKSENLNDIYLCFSDPSGLDNVGWTLRLFLVALVYLCPNLRGKTIQIISIRATKCVQINKSLLFTVQLTDAELDKQNFKWIGWEQHNGKLQPRLSKMADTMDPERLARNAVHLNLRLMKWRLMPDLDLEKISAKKCLLMGAGTLGCTVARSLLAWGVKTITFIDYGKVSLSNPARQSLYTYADAQNGGQEKATTAAKRMNEICSGLECSGYKMHIPMPGHTVGESLLKETIETITSLERLVQDHDVVFLLTDSRESRWLPTILGAAHDKIVINAALGFDSYLVMRHGTRKINPNTSATNQINGLKCIDGDKLGCYFCNDITAPGNSMKDRTLDQQCTVTRPGVSNIAGSLAVELLVSVIQHPNQEFAPAYISTSSDESSNNRSSIPEGMLGIIPHSIRGQLCSFEQILPATEKFTQCIACSEKVLDEYRSKGHGFLLKVIESAKYLEDLTGISELLNEDHEIIELESGSDFELSD